MLIKENYVREDSVAKVYSWGNNQMKLKNEYKGENQSEVKVYKLNEDEMDQYVHQLEKNISVEKRDLILKNSKKKRKK